MRLIDGDALIENQFKNDISYKAFVNLVKRQPTIEPERKKGEWICTDDIYEDGVCSCCGLSEEVYEYVKNWKYCPNCGAEMDI